MEERGATGEEIKTVEEGERFPAKFGRTGFRRNFPFGRIWRGRAYQTKQVEAYAVPEGERLAYNYRDDKVFWGGGGAMKLSYDPRYNIAYIRLREKAKEVETIRISDELNVDLSPDGKIYGIELLNAHDQLQIMEEGKVVLTDESTGRTVQLPISTGKS
jgi:uncharacterized protein YuzE